ncbi:MAG: DUF177 domain-containing protein [Acidimicrobiales bacterium]
MLIGISDIRGKVGSQREIQRTVDLGSIELESARVRSHPKAELNLSLEVIVSGMSLAGTARVTWTGECRRCLEDVAGELLSELDEFFELNPTAGETYSLGADVVDIEPAVRDAVVLCLPMTPLCTNDCVGPDPQRFPTTTEAEEPQTKEPPRDPRWAALDNVKFD